MAEDFYGTGDEPVTDAAPEAQDKGSGKTYLINSDVCPGMKPGDEMVLRIVRVLDGEYETEYSPSREDDEIQESPESTRSEPQMAEMGGMYD